jgi:hypothetical protein
MIGTEYAKWVADAEKLRRLMKAAGFLARPTNPAGQISRSHLRRNESSVNDSVGGPSHRNFEVGVAIFMVILALIAIYGA